MVLLLMRNVIIIIIIIASKCDIEIVWCLKKDAWEKIENKMYQHSLYFHVNDRRRIWLYLILDFN